MFSLSCATVQKEGCFQVGLPPSVKFALVCFGGLFLFGTAYSLGILLSKEAGRIDTAYYRF